MLSFRRIFWQLITFLRRYQAYRFAVWGGMTYAKTFIYNQSLCGLQNDEAANKTTMAIIYLLLHRPWRDSTFVLHNLYQKKKSNNDVLLQRFIRTNFDFKITIIMRCGVEMFIYFRICSVFIGHCYALYSCQGNNIYDLSVHNNSCRWLQKYDCCKIQSVSYVV